MRLLFVFISAALSFILLSCGDTAKKIDTSKLTLDSLITLYPDSVELLVKKGNELIENIQQDSINTPESVKGKLTRSIEAISNKV